MKKLNKELRQRILERDDYACQLGAILANQFGLSTLGMTPCDDKLQAHHKTYIRAGCELDSDLITVCQRCHDILTSLHREAGYERKRAPYQPENRNCRDDNITLRRIQ
jgi:hypothetical protein